MKKILMLLFPVCLLCGSCEENIIMDDYIVIEKDAVYLEQSESVAKFSFEASESWIAAVTGDDVEWCTLSLYSGVSGSHSITITARENKTYSDRSAQIIMSSGTASDTLYVRQQQKDAIILAENEYTVAADGGELTFSVSANVDFETDINVKWISLIDDGKTKGLTDNKLTFKVAKNQSASARNGVLSFTYKGITQTVNVVQEANDAMNVVIVHSENEITGIDFKGQDVEGTIDWGDGSTVDFKSSHDYGKSGSKTIKCEVHGADSLCISSLNSISSIVIVRYPEQ